MHLIDPLATFLAYDITKLAKGIKKYKKPEI